MHKLCLISVAILIAGMTSANLAIADEPALIKGGERIIFLGDSNTYAGHYVALLDAYFRTARPELDVELINVGLSSETACGLSEPDHPYPRPTVHERLDRVLAVLKPDIVVACYGMNDGVYYPLDEARFAAYRAGIAALIHKVHDSGAKLVLLTPPAFDPLPMRRDNKLRPADAEKFAWFGIYEGYDEVMARYASWIMQHSESHRDNVALAVDIYEPIKRFLEERRRDQPDYVMSSDGVHFNEAGHQIIADKLWQAWQLGDKPKVDEKVLAMVEQREQLLRDAWLTTIGHKRPGTAKGLPMEEAQAKARALDGEIEEGLGR